MAVRWLYQIVLCLYGLQAVPIRTQIFPSDHPRRIFNVSGDRHGLVWLAADQDGVYRFDGFHYQKIPGFPLSTARLIAVEPGGAVWAGGKAGLARYDNSAWTLVLNTPVEDIAMGPAGLWVNAGGLRLLSPGQPERRFPEAKVTGELVAATDGSLWFPCREQVCILRPPDWRLESRENPAPGTWQKAVPEKSGRRYWLGSRAEVALVEGNSVLTRKKAEILADHSRQIDPDLSPQGNVWINRSTLRSTAATGAIQTIAPESGRSFYPDEGTRWFADKVMLRKTKLGEHWEGWVDGLSSVVSPHGFVERDGTPPFVYSGHGFLEVDVAKRMWVRSRSSAPLDIRNSIEDGFGGYWLATIEEGLVRTGSDFAILERFPQLCATVDGFCGMLRDGRGRTWVGGKSASCLFEIQGRPGNWKFVPQSLPDGSFQTVEFQTDSKGRPWAGYQHGIAYLSDSGEWRLIRTSEPVTFIRTIAFDGDDVLWIAHREGGFFTRLERKGEIWLVRRFPAEKYGPAETNYLRRDSRGWIWRGTKTDVQVARPGHYEPAEWLHLTQASGLASSGSSLHGWVEDKESYVWLAGDAGITRIKPSADWFGAPKSKRPIVSRVSAGGQTWLDPDRIPAEIPANNGPVEIDLSGTDANPFQEWPLKYRLRQDRKWTLSNNGSLHFSNLTPGDYTLEAAYTGDGEAEVMRWQFHVGYPGMSFFYPAVGMPVAGVLGLLGWRKRKVLLYRMRKRAYFLKRDLLAPKGGEPSQVTWTNYAGRTLAGRYEVIETISHSGISTAYRGRDSQTGRTVVIKVLHRLPGQEAAMRNRFAHEVAALHTLSGTSVVALLDSWVTPEGEPCLAMPYLDGPTLRQYLTQRGPLNPDKAAQILEQLSGVIAAIHESGIIHRDLKPENVILLDPGTAAERAVLIDFGSCAPKGPEAVEEMTVTLTGSLHYLAPERLAGHYSSASDMYSLGVMVLEMVTGKRPAELDVTPEVADFVSVVGIRAGEAAAEMIAQALLHQPSKRPPELKIWAAELARLLREFTASHPTQKPAR